MVVALGLMFFPLVALVFPLVRVSRARRTWYVLTSKRAMVWRPGQQTMIHDHVAWCVTGVLQGQEHEEIFALADGGRALRLSARRVNPAGSVSGFAPPGDIHRVRNAGDTVAVSMHVYGADISRLGNSIRREYTLPVVTDA